jgi:hypothetical protein
MPGQPVLFVLKHQFFLTLEFKQKGEISSLFPFGLDVA